MIRRLAGSVNRSGSARGGARRSGGGGSGLAGFLISRSLSFAVRHGDANSEREFGIAGGGAWRCAPATSTRDSPVMLPRFPSVGDVAPTEFGTRDWQFVATPAR